eukprot:TRINITY_DN33649_c0_g1_i1.p1 TRINITY_DN33649_c0_g1~~TRINITY_DN33649_c0_g1_i1.p1  ORF type:complete len:330 (-),score=71.12 TRINITY_DN33649_c0_g1_i1:219-1208(-)
MAAAEPKFVVFGKTGWIGGVIGELLTKRGFEWKFADCRMEEREKVLDLLKSFGATHVMCAAGVTGRPNVDWCEDHRVETNRANAIGTLTLADCCEILGVHMVNFATGCIFHYDEKHPLNIPRDPQTLVALDRSLTFGEDEQANFNGSYYSRTKGYVEDMLRAYSNVCTLRVRMPIDSNLDNPRNFVYKIANYNKIVNIPNSMTILTELLPYAIELSLRKRCGIYNFCNPGAISHNQVMELYKMYIDPEKEWSNFTVEEQAKVIVAARSNNELNPTKLWEEFPDMLPIRDSYIKYVFKPNQTEASKKAFEAGRFKEGVFTEDKPHTEWHL